MLINYYQTAALVDRSALRDKDHKTHIEQANISSSKKQVPLKTCGQMKQISKLLQWCSRSLCWRVSSETVPALADRWAGCETLLPKHKSIQSWSEFLNQENVKIKYYPTLTLTIKLYIIFCLKPILGPLRFLNCDIIFMSINDFSPQNDLFISITRVKLISELLNDVDGI